MMKQQSKLLLVNFIVHVATIFGIYYYWSEFIWLDFLIINLAIIFFAITVAECFVHRYCTHMAYKLNKGMETFLIYCSTFTLHPPILVWAPNHITHHKYPDIDGDSHPASDGWKTWFWYDTYKNNMISSHTVKRLLKNKHYRIQYENFFIIYVISIMTAMVISPFYTLCILLIPAVFTFHIAGIINVLCHTLKWGYRNFDTKDTSVNINIFPFSCSTLHNNHHKNPSSITTRVHWYEIDIGEYIIKMIRI